MNKKLIALAVAGACVAPAAMAQTANPVTLYGRVYVTFESVEARNGSPEILRRQRVEDQSSLLGVRGTEDLGGGLKAFFQLETAFRADQNTTTFATRNSAVGLQGAWGSILMGRWDMPFKTATIQIDPFGDLTIGGITVANNDQGNFDRRGQNVIQYWTPNWAGFAARVAMTANEGRTATLNPRDMGASVTYTAGPLFLLYAYEEHKDASATLKKEEGNALGGNLTFGPLKFGLLYEQFKKTSLSKKKSWLANAVYTMGNNQLIYQYQNAKDGAAAGAPQPDCKVHSFGDPYNFSRRTFFLGQYTKVDNNAAANCSFGGTGFTIAKDQDPQGVSIGLRHIF